MKRGKSLCVVGLALSGCVQSTGAIEARCEYEAERDTVAVEQPARYDKWKALVAACMKASGYERDADAAEWSKVRWF